MLNVVLDTNVWISALIVPEGKSAQIVAHWKVFTPMLSESILAEIRRVIEYPRIKKRYRLTDDRVADFISNLRRISTFITVQSSLHAVPEDPKDDMVVDCAVDGNANYIVSSNPHLLRLREYRGIRILTPSQFLSEIQPDL